MNPLARFVAILLLGQYVPYPQPHAVSGTSNTPFITSQTLGTLRSDFDGCVGMLVAVDASPLTVTDLGRWVVAGNSGTHLIAIMNVGSGAIIISATVNTSGAPAGAYKYVSITPTVLSASTTYFIADQEANAGDQWYNSDTAITGTSTADAVVDNAAFVSGACGSGVPMATGSAGSAFVPTNFKYQ